MTVLMGLDARLKMARLYLCTDLRSSLDDFAEFVEAAFSGGVDMLQVRHKGLDIDAEVEALELARTISYRYQGLVVVNDRPEVAKASNADVLHLGQDDTEPKVARAFLHQWGLIGRSTHSEEQARQAVNDSEVNYFCVGPVFATPTKPDYPAVGLDLVRCTSQLQPPAAVDSKPWFAIGGIDESTIDDVIAAGARRAVVVRAITEAKDPEAAARRLADRLRQAWEDDPDMRDHFLRSMKADGHPTFRTNPDGSITVDEQSNASAAMPTGQPESFDPTPGEGSSRHLSRNDRGYGRNH